MMDTILDERTRKDILSMMREEQDDWEREAEFFEGEERGRKARYRADDLSQIIKTLDMMC